MNDYLFLCSQINLEEEYQVQMKLVATVVCHSHVLFWYNNNNNNNNNNNKFICYYRKGISPRQYIDTKQL